MDILCTIKQNVPQMFWNVLVIYSECPLRIFWEHSLYYETEYSVDILEYSKNILRTFFGIFSEYLRGGTQNILRSSLVLSKNILEYSQFMTNILHEHSENVRGIMLCCLGCSKKISVGQVSMDSLSIGKFYNKH